eukprot:CAMPEP_0184992038 /NCGR_PEP_ID=MMETSP1098-20130426/39456_1 /TAXON_ID=89044 /ORGANISM="Spumella elongata, Strain CCAP 955/1" /LENGTH=47 /DNA_ID= /DNA_START= /DNA_END= /DNA_ORIENTATION=
MRYLARMGTGFLGRSESALMVDAVSDISPSPLAAMAPLKKSLQPLPP